MTAVTITIRTGTANIEVEEDDCMLYSGTDAAIALLDRAARRAAAAVRAAQPSVDAGPGRAGESR